MSELLQFKREKKKKEKKKRESKQRLKITLV